MIDQLNLALWSWIESIRGMRQRQIWGPLLGLIAVQILVLVLLLFFYEPILAWFMVPLIRFLGADPATHYPQLFLVLPALFSRAGVWLDWIVGSFFFGLAYLVIWRLAAGASTGNSWKEARRSYGKLLLIRMPPIIFAVFLIFGLPALLPTGENEVKGNALRLLRYGSFLFGVIIEAIFVYAPLSVVGLGRGAAQAMRDTFSLARRTPVATFLIVLLPNLAQIPISAVLRRTDSMVRNLTPESVAWMLLLSILIYGLVNYFILASAVRIFGTRFEAAQGGRS